ncbi:tyrosinase precursor [Grosmannia clavigera kw1407]|uniref:Tyrosinase n=1 Tax=Grosmannia clavigera (strain kw1407 / UAMH 11150) TaxID=655863 RepID=F0X9F8_GROCL|nr:tyrosinase precursor [Grosmannia clavigera kw1407]EFX05338.1 tyrosinase precursor [Grosmannia clavigera kw1407]
MLVLLSIILIRLATPVASQMYDYGFEVDHHLFQSHIQLRDTATPYVVGNILHATNTTAVRQEIRKLEQDPDLWTLYMLGLNMMQYVDQNQLLSYYQVAGSNDTLVALALNRNFESIQQRLYNLFSNYDSYGNFSNKAWIPPSDSGKYDSLESLHDTIHSLAGLQGHMSWIPFSSFDPIFFLHHSMVDRAFALWQILYPDSWIKPTAATSNSFTTSTGQIQDSKTALTPFYSSTNGTFWTSDTVRDFGVFGYTYDDMVDFPRSSLTVANATTQSQVKALINQLYGKSSPAMLGVVGEEDEGVTERTMAQTTRRWTGPRQKERMEHEVKNCTNVQTKPILPHSYDSPQSMPQSLIADGHYREWLVNIRTRKEATGGAFLVHIFLGNVSTDTRSWAYAPNLVGTMGVFASPASAMTGMDMKDSHAFGTVPLTLPLAQRVGSGELASLEPEVVQPYLGRNLKYAVATTGGEAVVPKDASELSITVVSSVVQVPSKANELPRWGDIAVHFTLS